jgi:hypothetical protein
MEVRGGLRVALALCMKVSEVVASGRQIIIILIYRSSFESEKFDAPPARTVRARRPAAYS